MNKRIIRVLLALLFLPAVPGMPALPALPALYAFPAMQAGFEKAIGGLSSPDAGTRLRAVQALKAAGSREAAVPLAQTILDPFDETQLESIAAELNIFLAEKVTPKKRVGFLVEERSRIAAEPIFAAGPSAIG